MKTVFLFIPNYVYTSDLLRTEYIKCLSSKYKVVVFLPSFIFKNLDTLLYHRSLNIIYAEWKIKNERLLGWSKLFRVSCIKEFDHLATVQYNYRFFFGDWKRKFLKKISDLFPKTLTADFFSNVEMALVSGFGVFQGYCRKYNPVFVLTCTPGLTVFEAEAVLLAKKTKIPTVAIDFSWDNLTSNSKHIRKTDYLITWNNIIKNEATTLHGYPKNHVFASGALRFDHNFQKQQGEPTREEFLIGKNLNPSKKTILFSTVTRGIHPFQKEFVRDLISLRDKKIVDQPNILIRLHPKDNLENYEEFLRAKDLHIETAGKQFQTSYNNRRTEMNETDLYNLKYTLMYTDININCFSSISLEAFIFDKPVVNVSSERDYCFYPLFEHYKPLIEEGAVKFARSLDELVKYLNLYLENPGIDREARGKISRKFVRFSDGLSFKRNVDFLDTIYNSLP